MGFEVLWALVIMALCDMVPCSLVVRYQHFRGTCSLCIPCVRYYHLLLHFCFEPDCCIVVGTPASCFGGVNFESEPKCMLTEGFCGCSCSFSPLL
jgi:hypothetical protein